jgi:hypothetical protein
MKSQDHSRSEQGEILNSHNPKMTEYVTTQTFEGDIQTVSPPNLGGVPKSM